MGRKFPPLATELSVDLGISSPIFQRVVFTAILRRMDSLKVHNQYPAQARFEGAAIAIFIENQRGVNVLHQNRPLNLSPQGNSEYDVHIRNSEAANWGQQLQALCHNYELMVIAWRREFQVAAERAQCRPPPTPPVAIQTPSMLAQVPVAGRGRGGTRLATTQAQSLASSIPGSIGQDQRPRPVGSYDTPPQQIAVLPSQPSRPQPVRPVTKAPRGPFFPPQGHIQPQPVHPQPRSSLHQANLRSPILQTQNPHALLYQSVQGFAHPPTRLPHQVVQILKLTFTVSPEMMQSIPKSTPGPAGRPAHRVINSDSRLLRFRCVKWPSDTPDESDWSVADTSWLPNSFYTCNGVPLQPRKKLHHGKDLPIDITSLVKVGDNTLEIACVLSAGDEIHPQYLFAVEILGFTSHHSIVRECMANHIPANKILGDIQTKLLGGSDDDDEIAILQSNIIVDLFDPFSRSQICETPVRGKTCLHHNCFDLETFLQTRSKKNEVSLPDNWKCPICRADARPQSLILDGFLQEVRETLRTKGLTHTRAIVVNSDGTWIPKEEPCTGSESLDMNERKPSAPVPAPPPAAVIDPNT